MPNKGKAMKAKKEASFKDDAAKKKRPCPKEATNDVSWYLKDGTPRFSGEFDDLQKVGTVDRCFPNGIALDTVLQHQCVVAPPSDEQASFYKQMATLLSKIRKKNTGANIYSTEVVFSYISKILAALTAAAQVAKEIKAVAHVMPGNADSPWITLNMANKNRDWQAEATVLADTKNKADIVFKMIDALPCPDFAALERNIFLFSGLFADSKGGKPSFTTFCPNRVADVHVVKGTGTNPDTLNVTWESFSGYQETISQTLDKIVKIVAEIYNDVGGNFTMLRGDLIKYWKPKPRAMSMLYSVLPIAPVSAELAAQLENASILGRNGAFAAGDFSATCGPTGNVVTVPCGGALNPDIESKAELDEYPINSHTGVPTDGELMAITALMPVAKKHNGVTSTKWEVDAHNGVFIWDTEVLLTTSKDLNPAPVVSLVGMSLDNVHSSVQSTMKTAYETLQWFSSIVAHSPLLITDKDDPAGFIWDVDYIGLITKSSLKTAITRVIRSLYQIDLPERDA